MADSFANVYCTLRKMEAMINRAINDKPLYDEDVPPTTTICPPLKLTIAVDATGPFSKPFAAVVHMAHLSISTHY
jgi:hypothetical protein